MGVKGLWTLLDPTGKPVTLESLEGKVLAVDVSIWLHHLLHGMRDRHGEAVHNAHLVGLFTRVCKLLFYKIRPIFVFDGGVPELKKQTLMARRQVRSDATERSEEVSRKLLTGLLKRHAVNAALSGPSSAFDSRSNMSATSQSKGKKQDMFELQPLPEDAEIYDKGTAADLDRALNMRSACLDMINEEFQDPEDIDPDSEDFKALPVELRYELLNELKEIRKNRRGIHYTDMPVKSEDFSQFQIARMMHKSQLTAKLVNVRKEINAQASGAMVHGLTGYSGLEDNVEARRLISSDSSHYILIKGLNKQSKTDERANLLIGLERGDHLKTEESDNGKEAVAEAAKPDPADVVSKHVSDVKYCEDVREKKEAIDHDIVDITIPSVASEDVREKKEAIEHDIVEITSPSVASCSDVKPIHHPKGKKSDSQAITIGSDSDVETRTSSPTNESAAKNIVCTVVAKPDDGSSQDFSMDGGFIRDDSESEASKSETEAEKDGGTSAVAWESRDYMSVRGVEPVERQESESGSVKTSDESDNEMGVEKTKESRNIDISVSYLENSTGKKTDEEASGEGSLLSVRPQKELTKATTGLTSANPEPSEEKQAPFSSDTRRKIVHELLSQSETIEDKPKESTPSILALSDPLSEENLPSKKLDESGIPEMPHTVADVWSHEGIEETSDNVSDNDDDNDGDFVDIPAATHEDLREEPAPQLDLREEPAPKLIADDSNRDIFADLEPGPSGRQDKRPADLDVQRMQELITMDRELVTEADRLQSERGKLDRQTATLSDQIMAEAQELLRLFGVPYVVSPMEAEAQCAELDLSGQTHGTITDDSDIWLFGGKKVYKNMFNQGKYVESYNISSIESQLMLGRESLITVAYLCGSDYTPGIAGVGPVTALELLAEFKASSGLEQLRLMKSWWDKSKRKTTQPIVETKTKAKLRKLKLRPGFPSSAVWTAYTQPVVDHDRSKFSWEKPDLDLLRAYALEKFGWSQTRTDESLLPVIKRLSEISYQTHITSFFSVDFEPKKPKSKRVKQVLDRLQGKDVPVPLMVTNSQATQRAPRKRQKESKDGETTPNGRPAKAPKPSSSGEGVSETKTNVGSTRGRGRRKQSSSGEGTSGTKTNVGATRGRGRRNTPNRNTATPTVEETQSDPESDHEDNDKLLPSTTQSPTSNYFPRPDANNRGQKGRGRGRGSRGTVKRGRRVVIAQKQRGGSLKILHCPNKKNIVEEVNLSESSSDED